METFGLIKSFIDYDDAFVFFETNLQAYLGVGWEIKGAEVVWVNFHWRVGLNFERKLNDTL